MSAAKNVVIALPQWRIRMAYSQAVETAVFHYWRMTLIVVHPLLLQACPPATADPAIIDFGTCYQSCFRAQGGVDHAAAAVVAVAVNVKTNFSAVVIAVFEDLLVERHPHHYQAAVVVADCAPNLHSSAADAIVPGLPLAADDAGSSHSSHFASWEPLPFRDVAPDPPPAAHGAGFQYLKPVRRSNKALPEPAAADDDGTEE